MKGLTLRRLYWEECARPILFERFPHYINRMAVGALGHGSEFLGFDDEVSRDHDWGPAFMVFLTEKDFRDIGHEVLEAITSLPQGHRGYEPKWSSRPEESRNRVYIFKPWVKHECRIDPIPETDAEWLGLHDPQLLWATNGEIWHDPLGEVTATRQSLGYYPESVWLKRLALKCHQLGQYAPYQVDRFLKRGDPVTVDVSFHFFLLHTMKMCFLLRRSYAPIYKWLHSGFLLLPDWLEDFKNDVHLLASPSSVKDKMQVVHRIHKVFLKELKQIIPTLAESEAVLGLAHGRIINNAISDTKIRAIDLFRGQVGGMDF